MDTARFLILGLTIGGIYALVAHGLVLVFKGSGLVNFAQGAFVMVGGYSFYEFRVQLELPALLSLVLAVAFTALVGAAFQLLVLRFMSAASPTERVVATLALLVVLQATVFLKYGDEVRTVPSILPERPVEIGGGLTVGLDRLMILGISALVTALLWGIYRYSNLGLVTAAVAENETAAAALGHSPNRVAMLNWAAGAALAGFAGVLISPISLLQSSALALLIVPALAIGLFSGFSSFPITFAAGLAVGVVQAFAGREFSIPGISASIPFFAVIALLVIRGRGLPIRSYITERLPPVGDGRVRYVPLAVTMVISVFLLLTWVNESWALAITGTLATSVICVSVVLLTGYAGQLSLAQFVIAGVGALAAARAMRDWNLPFLLALVAAAVAGAIVGLAVGLPALRTRGATLAIATFGLASVLYSLVLNNETLSGASSGITVETPTIFGWDLDSFFYPQRYSVVALVVLVLFCLLVSNVRRGALGRRMLAIRGSERAAAALGVSVYATKIYAFTLASMMAAVGGAVLALANGTVVVSPFNEFSSINIVTVAVVGGIGFVGGGLTGALLLGGGVATYALSGFHDLDGWLPLVTGIYLLVVLRSSAGSGGVYQLNRVAIVALGRLIGRLVKPLARVFGGPRKPTAFRTTPGRRVAGTSQPALSVRDLGVRFGGVVALSGVDLDVKPGTVHGLIGPNGAGKTTFIDAVSGFVRPAAGVVKLAAEELQGWGPVRVARHGLGRSFQSVELFSDITVLENLAVGSDDFALHRYLSGLLRPGRMPVSEAAIKASQEFGLEAHFDELPTSLSFGDRRLVSIARALASEPRVLLLDEPAAGLDTHASNELKRVVRWLADDLNIAVLLVEHNLDLVLAVSDTVTVLDRGKVIYAGPPEGVRSDPGVVAAYIGEAVENPGDTAPKTAAVNIHG
jgi:ABC-type branched-subunit amino acid transport system ATPase component/branched-subunit amino acid ABC-type transport system permease component